MDSRDSSPRSLDTTDHHHHHRNPSFEEQQQPLPKVKLMCSYGGRIQPRPHHNHLTYVAGDTKILAVDRHIKFPTLTAKLSSLSNSTTTTTFFKYQLPGEDLDALISVTNDDDLHHMMIEYDRLSRASPRPARLRLFLFSLTTNILPQTESKTERQWFVEALNSVHIPLLEGYSSPPMVQIPFTANPDFLFGLDKPSISPNNISADFNGLSNDNNNNNDKLIGKSVPESELEQELSGNKKLNEDSGNGSMNNGGDCYAEKNAEKVTAPLVAHNVLAQVVRSGSVPETASFSQERNNAGYSFGVPTTGNEIYLIQTPSGIFQAVRHVTGPVGQPVYYVHAPGSEVAVAAERGYAAARGDESWM